MKNQRQKHDYKAMEPSKKRILSEKKQVKIMTNELKMKQLRKYETTDIVTKEDLLNKKQTYTKEWLLLKNKIC